jgi:hypothetical protein
MFSHKKLELVTFPFKTIPSSATAPLVETDMVLSGRSRGAAKFVSSRHLKVVKLPREMACNYPLALQAVEQDPKADCYSFAHLLLGLECEQPLSQDRTTPAYRPGDWEFHRTDSEELELYRPGTCFAYGPTETAFTPGHWAIACGRGRVLQCLGAGDPIAITSIEAPATFHNNPVIVTASPVR